jgi:hypothetical protein
MLLLALFNNGTYIHLQCCFLYCNVFVIAINEYEDQWGHRIVKDTSGKYV